MTTFYSGTPLVGMLSYKNKCGFDSMECPTVLVQGFADDALILSEEMSFRPEFIEGHSHNLCPSTPPAALLRTGFDRLNTNGLTGYL